MITNEIRELAEDFANKVKAILAADLPIDLGGLACLQKNGPRVLKRVDGWELGIQAYVAAILLGHLGGAASVDGGEVVYRVGDHTIYIRNWIRKWITSPGPDSIAFKVAGFIQLQSRPRKTDPEEATRGADELARELSVRDDERQLVDRYFADLVARAEAALRKSHPSPGITLEDLQAFERLDGPGRVYFWARAEFIEDAGQWGLIGDHYWSPMFDMQDLVLKKLFQMVAPTPNEFVAAIRYFKGAKFFGTSRLWDHICAMAKKIDFWRTADRHSREESWKVLLEVQARSELLEAKEIEFLAKAIGPDTPSLLRQFVEFLRSKKPGSVQALVKLLEPIDQRETPDWQGFRACMELWSSLARGRLKKNAAAEWPKLEPCIKVLGRDRVHGLARWIIANPELGRVELSGRVFNDTMFVRMRACANLLLERLA